MNSISSAIHDFQTELFDCWLYRFASSRNASTCTVTSFQMLREHFFHLVWRRPPTRRRQRCSKWQNQNVFEQVLIKNWKSHHLMIAIYFTWNVERSGCEQKNKMLLDVHTKPCTSTPQLNYGIFLSPSIASRWPISHVRKCTGIDPSCWSKKKKKQKQKKKTQKEKLCFANAEKPRVGSTFIFATRNVAATPSTKYTHYSGSHVDGTIHCNDINSANGFLFSSFCFSYFFQFVFCSSVKNRT